MLKLWTRLSDNANTIQVCGGRGGEGESGFGRRETEKKVKSWKGGNPGEETNAKKKKNCTIYCLHIA